MTLPAHVELSVNLNLFIFDQEVATQRYTIAIIVDGQSFPIKPAEQTINITGTSNECDLSPGPTRFEAMKTFETQTFVKHKKTENVVVGVSLGTSAANAATKWGIRDIRLVFKRCDDNCENCTSAGCQKCRGFFQLSDF